MLAVRRPRVSRQISVGTAVHQRRSPTHGHSCTLLPPMGATYRVRENPGVLTVVATPCSNY